MGRIAIQINTNPNASKDKSPYDIDRAFEENDIIPWRKEGHTKDLNKNDIIYLCVLKDDIRKIMYKCIVYDNEANASETIDDSKYCYYKLSEEEKRKNRTGKCNLIKKLQYIKDDRLLMSELYKNGYTNVEYIHGSIKDKNSDNIKFFSYLDEIFKENKDDEDIKSIKNDFEVIVSESQNIEEKYRKDFVKTRIGQGKFREMLIKKHSCKCSVCGLNMQELLVASHIKEYVSCINNEHIDLKNGLLLCANHDKLFDKHLISFDCYGKVIISDSIDSRNYKNLNIDKDITIDKNLFKEEYMNYHRKKLI